MTTNNSKILFGLMVVISTALMSLLPVHAQTPQYWSKPKIIPYYTDRYPPSLLVDQNRVVHAFNSQRVDQDNNGILYRQWNYDTGWTEPSDILIPENATAQSLQGVLLDQGGRFHLVYQSGAQQEAVILYTTAWAAEAGKSNAWAVSAEIGQAVHVPTSASLAGDGKDFLLVIYSGDLEGLGLYETHSRDRGLTWSTPKLIQVVDIPDVFPFHIRYTMDPKGILHVVWSWMNNSGLGESVFYSNYDPLLDAWSTPYLIASKDGSDYAADWASIIYHNNELILMYMDGIVPGGIPPTRWMRRSGDDGQTWSDPIAPFPQVGENGFAEMLVDSNQDLHIILANRVGNPPISGIWHGTWLGNQWGPLELIGSSLTDGQTSPGYDQDFGDASRPSVIIAQGNVLLATWWHDMQDPPPAAYSYIQLNAPELPQATLPVAIVTSIPSPVRPDIELTQLTKPEIATALPAIDGTLDGVKRGDLTTTIIMSGVTSVLLIAGIVIYRIYLSNRSR